MTSATIDKLPFILSSLLLALVFTTVSAGRRFQFVPLCVFSRSSYRGDNLSLVETKLNPVT